jgi:adenylate cyclase
MPVEIERKFLVASNTWRAHARPREGVSMRQGYIPAWGCTVRVRIAGRKGFLTIKGRADESGLSRDEFEFPIPLRDAMAMLEHLCHRPLVEKTRYHVRSGGVIWEVDVFEGDNQGLIVAEVELKSEKQSVKKPEWVGKEVTRDRRYRNSSLARRPFAMWGAASRHR